jgi:glycine cleavage system aminomethyltransferase T
MRTAIRRSPAALLSSQAGAVFVEEAGWEIPASYGDDGAEREAIRRAVAISDITARGKVDLQGGVDRALSAVTGTLVARVAGDWALVLGGPGEETKLLAALRAAAGETDMVTDATHLFAGFALAGPRLPGLLERTTSWDVARLAPGEATGAPIVEIRSVMVRRDVPIPLLEVYVATESARYAWETLAGVAARMGGGPAGWQALREEGWS